MFERHMLGLILCCLSSFSWGSPDGQQELLKQNLRPTFAEFVEKMKPMPAANPFLEQPKESGGGFNPAPEISNLPALAALIAKLEHAFPGGIWAPIGRDYVMIADAMDAFYISMGQPGRVKRLNVSGGSFTWNQQDIIDFLKTFGLNFDPKASPPPVVAMDDTTYSSNSQSTLLMIAGYTEFKNRGGDLKTFLHRFNIVNLGYYHFRGGDPKLLAETVFKEQKAQVDQLGWPPIPLTLNAGAYMATDEWHGTWGRFTRLDDGKVITFPTSNNPLFKHARVLAQFYETYKAVSDASFLNLVKAECRKLGFEFPLRASGTMQTCNKAYSAPLTKELH